jgi:hypothetical protein
LNSMDVAKQRFLAPEVTKLRPVGNEGKASASTSVDIFQMALDTGNLLAKKPPLPKSRPPFCSTSITKTNVKKASDKLVSSESDSKKLPDSSSKERLLTTESSKRFNETLPASYSRKTSVLGKYKIPKKASELSTSPQPSASDEHLSSETQFTTDVFVESEVSDKIEGVPPGSSDIVETSTFALTLRHGNSKVPPVGSNLTLNLREQFAMLAKDNRKVPLSDSLSQSVKQNNVFERFCSKDEDPPNATPVSTASPSGMTISKSAPSPTVTPSSSPVTSSPSSDVIGQSKVITSSQIDVPKSSNFWSMMQKKAPASMEVPFLSTAANSEIDDPGISFTEASSSLSGAF